MMFSEHPFVVTGTSEEPSRHGGWINRVTLTDLVTGREWHTYVDPQNRNARWWRPVIDASEHHIVIVTGLRARAAPGLQIDADSRPQIQQQELATEARWHVILDYLEELR
jgi:hypothetical protein